MNTAKSNYIKTVDESVVNDSEIIKGISQASFHGRIVAFRHLLSTCTVNEDFVDCNNEEETDDGDYADSERILVSAVQGRVLNVCNEAEEAEDVDDPLHVKEPKGPSPVPSSSAMLQQILFTSKRTLERLNTVEGIIEKEILVSRQRKSIVIRKIAKIIKVTCFVFDSLT